MQKKSASQSGLFNPRVLIAFTLCTVGVGLALLSFATTIPTAVTGSEVNSAAGSILGSKVAQSSAAMPWSGLQGSAANGGASSPFVDKYPASLTAGADATIVSGPLAVTGAGAWAIVPSPNIDAGESLNALNGGTCLSVSDCWAVGYHQAGLYYQTLVERWDGNVWSIVPSPNTSEAQHNVLSAVTCVSGSDCWAVGYSTGGAQTLVEHWDGTSWAIITSPNASTTGNNALSAVTCVSASECWAVGSYSNSNGVTNQTLTERWNGNTWVIVTSPNVLPAQDSILNSVTCASATECWAVGKWTSGLTYQTLIERWDGTAWAIVSSPNTSGSDSDYFNSVTCSSTSDCWAVGYSSAGGGLIARWNGNGWSLVPSNNPSATQFSSVTCVSGSDCWVTGYFYNGAAQTLVERWDGTSWSKIPSPNPSTTVSQFLNSITCTSGSDCWAVGVSFASYFQTLMEHWDGNSWTIAASANVPSKQYNQLFGMTCVSASECWVVGGYGGFTGGRNYLSLIERWDGASWSTFPSPNTDPTQTNILNSVSCISASDCWAVGYHDLGLITPYTVQTLAAHWDGSAWSIVASPSVTQNDLLLGVTCTSISNCWAVGYHKDPSGRAETLIERWDGTSWTIVSSPNASPTASNNLFEVKCTSASECWAVGATGEPGVNHTFVGSTGQPPVERWDGTSWTIVTAPNPTAAQSAFFLSVACVSGSDCWAVGAYSDTFRFYQTLVEHWDGTAWAVVASPSTLGPQDNYLNAIACASASECWAVGYTGGVGAAQTLIERWDGTSWTIVNSPSVPGASENNLHGVTCVSESDCWAVGVDRGPNGVAQTLLEHYTSPLPMPTNVVSRKMHGTGGNFDIDLPLTGIPGIECRTEQSSGVHHVVFSFPSAVTVSDAMVTPSGSGKTAEKDGPPVRSADGKEVTVNLKNVSNAQTITVTLVGVNDGSNTGNVSVAMGVLLGDTTGDGVVDSGDITQTRRHSGQVTTELNKRIDVSVDGVINSADITLVRRQSGTALQ